MVNTLFANLSLFPPKQNPVVDSTQGKYSAISLIQYFQTKGIVIRSPGPETILGYCVESPSRVLRDIFQDWPVTRYNGYELFSDGDFKPTTPIRGLGIAPFNPSKVHGVQYTGSLAEFLKIQNMGELKRSKPVSVQDIERIVAHLREESMFSFMNTQRDQIRHDKQEIIRILTGLK